ncbi:aldehyde-activating protein [Pelagibius litoralis]|uniref:Aldehyde-activating protein n=1 Tax=Pelagibius litoralis TaxID=374515 RepID=A0A967K8Z7_9PROT|nr:aldehyde-activating protein [Pelagibius litoralis]NIA70723.1 aldehyde-activating protein [Pelagibius litoralis]
MQHKGGCHCGALGIEFTSDIAPEDMEVRTCLCSFCRKHGSRAVSDPAGAVRLILRDDAVVQRYRFGLATADYLLCGRCGVYVSAVIEDAGRHYAIVITGALENAKRFSQTPMPMDYDAEDEAARRARRRAKWTPAEVVVESS